MATKEERERLAQQLQDEARPVFLAIGLDENVVEWVVDGMGCINPAIVVMLLYATSFACACSGGCMHVCEPCTCPACACCEGQVQLWSCRGPLYPAVLLCK